MSKAKINQWGVYYINGLPKNFVPAASHKEVPTNASLVEQFKKHAIPYKAMIISNNMVNHNFLVSTALLLMPDKGSMLKKTIIAPTEFRLPDDLANSELRGNIIMGHMVHAVNHSRIQVYVGQLINEELRDHIRQMMRDYFCI